MENLYFLLAGTDHETHSTKCCCGKRSRLPHRAVGASLYELDICSLQALYNQVTGEDTDSFQMWCQLQRPQHIFYGLTNDAAIDAALREAHKEGWLIVNYPLQFPWILPVLEALRGIVGEDGYLSKEACECELTDFVCRICHARYVVTIISACL